MHLKFAESDDKTCSHQIFLKKYQSEKKSNLKPVGKTLLILNVPPYADDKSLSRVFSEASSGEVERVILTDSYKNEHKSLYAIKSKYFQEKLPFKFLIAFIVFKKSSSLETILRVKYLPALNDDEHQILTGIEKWKSEQNEKMSIDTTEMQQEINDYMKHYDKVKQASELQNANTDDDDGWITVGSKGNHSGFKQSESTIHKLEQKIENQKKKARQLSVKNYQKISTLYAFETRENKKQELFELRRKFQEDRKKINAMKQTRKFKPY
jgi:ribosomal RNA-processing protein 7